MKSRDVSANEGVLADERIIELYNLRDESAISATDRKYRSYLYTIAFNILSNNEDSEECLNDTYLKTWNSIPPAMPRVLKAFLSRITRNTAIDKYDMQTADKRVPIAACDDLSDFEGVLRDVGDMLSELETRKIYLSFLKKYGMAMYEVDNKVSFETLQEIFWGN
jgi:RNA polymerase sigma-70 factor (ECF subfamily)